MVSSISNSVDDVLWDGLRVRGCVNLGSSHEDFAPRLILEQVRGVDEKGEVGWAQWDAAKV
jgi:hypothetical protein